MLFRDAIEGREHDGHDNLIVLLDQRHDVLVIPEIQSPLCNLKLKTNYVKLIDQTYCEQMLNGIAVLIAVSGPVGLQCEIYNLSIYLSYQMVKQLVCCYMAISARGEILGLEC